MNSLGRNDQKKNKKDSIVFTKETLGVVLVLFSTLMLICLITRDVIFSVPGQAINAFLLGTFGYFSYLLCGYLIALGSCLVIGKKFNIANKIKALIISAIIILALLVHVITMAKDANLPYGEYLVLSYTKGAGGIATSSGGGIIVGLVAYVFSALLTNVGSYVILGVLLALNGYAIVKICLKGSKQTAKGENKFRSSYVAPKDEDTLEEKEYPVEGVDFTEMGTPKPPQKLFVNNAGDFEFKSRRDIKNESKTDGIKINPNGGLNVSSPSPSYSTSYGEEMQSKINYIKTPAKIDVDRTLNNSYGSSTNVSSPISRTEPNVPVTPTEPEVTEVPVENTVDTTPVEEPNIPFYEHDETVDNNSDSARSHAESFSGRYAEVEDLGVGVGIPSDEPAEMEKPLPPSSEPETTFGSTRGVVEEPVEETSSESSSDEIPFIDESEPEIEIVGVENEYEEPETDLPEPIVEDPVVEEPKPSSITGDRRVRRILFGDDEGAETVKPAVPDTPAYTSRVSADNNGNGRGIPFTAEPEEEPKKPDKEKPPINRVYHKPPIDLLENYDPPADLPKENHEERMEIIKQTLADFHINAEPTGYVQGPSVTRYEIMMPAGISVKRVLGLSEDLQMRLAVKDGVRIQAPIPGKNLIGVEVANKSKITVGLKEVITGMANKKIKPESLTFAIGKDIVGDAICDDLAKGPHYLVAGATGAGKSVCLNTLLVSLIMRYSPEDLRLILVDPKRVEFRVYEHLPHLMIDEIITDPKKVLAVLAWLVEEMERRYQVFEESGSLIDNIEAYNTQIAGPTVAKMPRIVLIIDELADLMSHVKKDLEARIQILTQKARAAGIHLVLATQRPSVNVITGVIKTNLPSRIAFKVTNFQDSQTILDKAGAEKLLGYGDMLYKNSVMPDSERYQGAFISKFEVSNVVSYIIEKNKAYFDDELAEYLERAVKPKPEETSSSGEDGGDSVENNEFFLKALALAINMGSISISMLQRRFQIGYSRAGGLVDKMDRMGFISGNEGSKARRVLITREEFEERFGPMPD